LALEKLKNASSHLDGLLVLEAELSRAENEGVVAPVPETQSRFFKEEARGSLLPALRDRLFRLGYLKTRKETSGIDEALTAAIRQMQSEAGLSVDGWVGAETWTALQELFAFDPSTNIERWIDQTGWSDALHRAVYLRLISFGYIEGRTRASLGSITRYLRLWRRTLLILEAPGITVNTPLRDHRLLHYLFDLDSLSGLVPPLGDRLDELINGRRAESKRLRRFLNCLLQIELWLLGYERVKPLGKPLTIKWGRRRVGHHGGSHHAAHIVKGTSVFARTIHEFWVDSGQVRSLRDDGEVLRHSFALLATLGNEDARDADSERNTQVAQVIEEVEKREAEVAREWEKRTLLGRLWDGAKRVWRFLKDLFRRAVAKLSLLARAAYQLAAEGFTIFRRSIEVFSEGLGLLWSPEIAGSNESISMYHDRDFDFKVFINQQGNSNDICEFFEGLERRLRSLRASLRILQIGFRIAMAAARLTQGPWGWWKLLRSMIALVRGSDREDLKIIGAAYV